MFSCLCLGPRTCQVPKTLKSDQGRGIAKESGMLCVKPGERKGSIIAESDSLENHNDVTELNAFVCLFLTTETTPQDGLGPR